MNGITVIFGLFSNLRITGMPVTLGNMRAIRRTPMKPTTRIFDINHLIRITYIFGIKLYSKRCGQQEMGVRPGMFRLLYNDFNVFDKKSGRIGYDDQAGNAAERLGLRTVGWFFRTRVRNFSRVNGLPLALIEKRSRNRDR